VNDRRSAQSVSNWLLCLIDEALVQAGRDKINRAYVAAGQIAWDDCCGMLVVGPERVYRSVQFPNEATGPEYCDKGDLTLDLVVVLVRCVPVVNDRGQAPSAKDLNDAYQNILEDGAIVWNSIDCAELPLDWQRANLSQTFVGAQGGCIGVETRVTIGLSQKVWSIQ
jgi:hypothetical protein